MSDLVDEPRVISFKSILPDSTDVRVSYLNGAPHVWAVDLILAMKGGDRNNAARILREVPESLFSSKNIITVSMLGRGNGRTKLVASDLVCGLVMAIPAITPEKLKTDACDIIRHFFDHSDSIPIDEAAVDEVEEVTRGIEKFSLASIIPNSEDVRVSYFDGEPLIWVVDLIIAIKGGTRSNASRDLDLIPKDLFDIQKLMVKDLPGNGKWPVRLANLPDAIDLVLVLPGDTAKRVRRKASNYMVRALAGDPTLILEIEEHAVSDAPINHIARASIRATPPAAVVALTAKRARVEIDYADLERRRNFICDSYKRYQRCSGGDIAIEVRQEYNRAMQDIFRYLNPSNSVVEPKRLKTGYVYCFQSSRHTDEVKIGCTNNVKRRLYEVNKQYRDNGNEIVFTYRYSVRSLNAPEDEKLAHAHFTSVRMPGPGELFRTTPESVRDFFEREIRPRYHQVDVDMDEGEEEDMDVEI